MKCPQYYLTEMQKVILFYNGLAVLTRQILDSKGATPTKTAVDAKLAIQDMAEYSQKWHNKTSRTKSTKTSDGLAAIQAQLNNLGREIKKRDHVKSILTTVEADMTLIRRIGSSQYTVSAQQNIDDLMPTIEEGEVFDKHMIEEVKAKNDNKMVSKIFGYPNDYDKDKKICIECAYNLKFSCMIGFEFVHAKFFPNLPINVTSKKLYNLIMKDKIEFRERNELGNFTNVPFFIRNFYVITDFIVVEDMDPYLDEGMGEVVVGEPFCEVSCVETRRFDGIITIHGEDESVTYQMVWSILRFKHHTNEQCNKISPLLK
ncbi:hypothetical protein Tco_1224327, partial [Tanacetum coccineum]